MLTYKAIHIQSCLPVSGTEVRWPVNRQLSLEEVMISLSAQEAGAENSSKIRMWTVSQVSPCSPAPTCRKVGHVPP